MGHEFKILHFGGQCPWHLWMIKQAREAANTINSTLEVVDVTNNPEIALEYNLFFPFMTIINDKFHLPSPITSEQLIRICREGVVSQPTISHIKRPEARAKKVEPLTTTNIQDSCSFCISQFRSGGCRAKFEWAEKIKNKVPKGILGFIAYEDNKTVAVVEFLPSIIIPYPLPEKHSTIAFITCIYSLENEHDYRGQVLDHLIGYLPALNYSNLQVIAGRRSAYPNGPVAFFTSYGFKELCELGKVILKEGTEDLVLMERRL